MQANRKFIIAVSMMALAIAAAWGASVPRGRVARNRTAATRSGDNTAARTSRANAGAAQATTAAPAEKPAENAEAAVDGPSFTDFNLIMSRNIFDATRRSGGARRPAARTTDTASVVDTIDLLGVLIDTNKAVAFTEGSRQDYTQTLKPGELVGGLKVASISTEGLKMEGTSQTIALWQVGTRLYRRENENWRIGESPRFSPTQIQSTRQNSQPRPSMTMGTDRNGGGRNSNQGRGGFSGSSRDNSQPSDRRGRGQPQTASSPQRSTTPQATTGATSGGSVDEIMARLREQRRRDMGQ